jgi:hypothetical protein
VELLSAPFLKGFRYGIFLAALRNKRTQVIEPNTHIEEGFSTLVEESEIHEFNYKHYGFSSDQ